MNLFVCDSETDAVALISLSTSIMKRDISDTCLLNHIVIVRPSF